MSGSPTIMIWPSRPAAGVLLASALRDCGLHATAASAPLDSLTKNPSIIAVHVGEAGEASIAFVDEMRRCGAANCTMVLIDNVASPDVQAAERVSVLIAGADDVQHLPMDVREIAARLRALSVRHRDIPETPVALPAGFYFRVTGVLVGEHCTISLTKSEASVFDLLVARAGYLVTKQQILTSLYAGRDEAVPKIVEVFICKLRKKLAPLCGDLEVIATEWGQGYRFVEHGFRPQRITALKRVAVRL